MINSAQWERYKALINKAHDSFNKASVEWFRETSLVDRYGEDNQNFVSVNLEGLISYNIFRTWPMTRETEGGTIDKESMVLILNKKYLEDSGYLDQNGNLDIKPSDDYFKYLGDTYRSAGETPVAQAGNEPLLIYLILKRQKR